MQADLKTPVLFGSNSGPSNTARFTFKPGADTGLDPGCRPNCAAKMGMCLGLASQYMVSGSAPLEGENLINRFKTRMA